MSIKSALMSYLGFSPLINNLCVFQVPDEEDYNEESLAHADHSKNKAEA